MAEAFKHLISAPLVQRMAAHLRRGWPDFDAEHFESLALEGLHDLEMKARAMHLCNALEAVLPADFDQACAVLEAALAPPWPGDRLGSEDPCRDGLEGWALWPVGEYIARHGQGEPERALRMLHALTQRFSAEFAIRPFIVEHPALTLATLQRWTRDPSAHVRRLCSEGSRPRLPWGLRLQALVKDPSPTLPLLRALQDDPSEYVRRSVANHLNDIAKDHPALIVDWLKAHLKDATPQRRALLKHASRSLIKQGHAPALRAWGLGRALLGTARLRLQPRRVALGESVQMQVSIDSTAASAQSLVIDYAVHHVKANGGTTPKVFKGWTLELPAHGHVALNKRHSMRAVTTRRYHAGRHEVDLRINGEICARAFFDLSI